MSKTNAQQPYSTIPFLFISHFGKKIRIIQAGLLLLSAIPVWVTTEVMSPQIVQAYTARVNLLIDRLPEETYENMLRRAESSARAAAQRSFDQDILVTEVSVIVSAQNYGAIAPLLSLDVTRNQWKKRPDPQRWAKYLKTSRALLFFDPPATNTKDNPSKTPTVTPTPPAGVKVPLPAPAPAPASVPAPRVPQSQGR
jgi:hypothetical protein